MDVFDGQKERTLTIFGSIFINKREGVGKRLEHCHYYQCTLSDECKILPSIINYENGYKS